MMRLLLISTTVLALAGCNPATEAPANNAAAIDAAETAAANAANTVNYVAEIGNMAENEQQGVFLRAIRDADISCRDVIKVERIEGQSGVPTWRAQCDQGAQHLIEVLPDGSAKVISRTTP